jgi:hypothetical protein
MRIIAVILALLASLPAFAEGPLTTDLRAAVLADDPAQAEALISAAHQAALASRDTTAIYTAFRRVFGSTNPARADFINHWISAFPDSAFAQTALAENSYMTAFAYQQGGVEYPNDSPAIQKRKHYFTLTRNAAQRAMVLDRSFSRATDLWLFVAPHNADPAALTDLARKTLEAAPNRNTVIFAATAVNDWDLAFQVCAELAPMVPDFAPDSCAIASVFTYNKIGEMPELAARALDANDDPELVQARVRSITWHQREAQYTADEAIAMHVSLLETTSDLKGWLQDGQILGGVYPDSFFAAEAITLAIDELMARLADDPFNPALILFRLTFQDYLDIGTANLPDPGPGGDMALWEGGLQYGYLTEGYWYAGSALLVQSGQGAAARLPYLENAAVVSEGSALSLTMLLGALGDIRGISGLELTHPEYPTPEPDVAHFVAAECPMLRASRLLLATCMMDRNINADECSDSSQAVLRAQVAVQQAKAGDLCPALATTPLRELVYKDMVAVPGFTPPTDNQ